MTIIKNKIKNKKGGDGNVVYTPTRSVKKPLLSTNKFKSLIVDPRDTSNLNENGVNFNSRKLFENNEENGINEQNNLALLDGNQVELLNMYHSNKYQNIKEYIPRLHNLASKKGLKIKVSAKKNPLIIRLRPELNLCIFIKDNIDRLLSEENSNNFLNEVYNILEKTNKEFKEFNDLRLINLFTEEFIFIKKDDENGDILVEPLIFSLMEMQIFNNYNNLFKVQKLINNERENENLINELSNSGIEELKNINKLKGEISEVQNKKYNLKIQKFIYKMFDNGYDIELNPFIIKNIGLFKILQNFFELKKIKKGGDLTSMINKISIESVRQNIDSAHNFRGMSNVINLTINKNLKKNKKKIIEQSIIKRVKRNNSRSINTTCSNEIYQSKSMLTNYDNEEEKNNTHKLIKLSNNISRKCSTENNILTNASTTAIKKRSFEPCYSDLEEKYLMYLMEQNKIGNNVFYFTFTNWNDPIKNLYFKELLYNVLGRYQFIINDANGLQHVLNFIYDDTINLNNYKNLFILYFIMKTSVLSQDSIFVLKNDLKDISSIQIKQQITNIITTQRESELIQNYEKNTIRQIEEDINKEIIDFNQFITKDLNSLNMNKLNEFELFFNEKFSKLTQIFKNKIKLQKIKKLKDKLLKFKSVNVKPSNTISTIVKKKTFKKYIKDTLSSWGMKLDPGTLGDTNDVPLFTEKLYEKLILDIFSDLQLNGYSIKIKCKSKNIDIINQSTIIDRINELSSIDIIIYKIFKIKMKDPQNSTKYIFEKRELGKTINFKINSDFNNISSILLIIKELIEAYKIELIRKYISEGNMLPINDNKLLNGKLNPQEIQQLKINKGKMYTKLKDKINIDTFNSYFELINTLFKYNFSLNEIIKFILRFKILGDKIQALEAKYRCSLIKDYNASPSDILVKRRILATQDRPLLAFAMVENNINFISKATFSRKEGKKTISNKVIFWNFGDIYNIFRENENKTDISSKILLLSHFKSSSLEELKNMEIDLNREIQNVNINKEIKNKYTTLLLLMKELNDKIKKIKQNKILKSSKLNSSNLTSNLSQLSLS